MARTGSLHIVCINARYVVYFAPHEGDLDRLPQRACSSASELETVLMGLAFDEFERLQLIAEVQLSSARTKPDVQATDAQLADLGFEFL
jgi:hypothetical protein